PLRRSTTAPGVSQVLSPSLVANACQTSVREAGMLISITSALPADVAALVGELRSAAKAVVANTSRAKNGIFRLIESIKYLLSNLVERSSKYDYHRNCKGESFCRLRPKPAAA